MDQSERLGDMVAAARSAAFEQRADMWTALPAIVEKYDEKKIITSAQPTIKGRWRDPQGKWHWVQLPLCLDCPVQFQSGGGYTQTFPIAKGDEGILIFSSRCIDKWWKDGGVQQQAVLRMHDLSDGMFIPGIRSQARKLDPPPATDRVVLRSDDGKRYVEIAGNYIRARLEDQKARVVVSSKEAKLRFGDHFILASKDGIICSELPIVGDDPDQNL